MHVVSLVLQKLHGFLKEAIRKGTASGMLIGWDYPGKTAEAQAVRHGWPPQQSLLPNNDRSLLSGCELFAAGQLPLLT